MGREEHCKQISLACVGCARSAWATLGLPQLMARVLSRSTLLRLQVALQGNCLKWALGYVHFPGLSSSGSGSWASTKVQTWLGLRSVPFPGPSSSGDRVLGERSLPRRGVHLITSPVPAAQFPGWQRVRRLRCAVRFFWGAGLWLRPSWQMSTAQNPNKSWLATGSLLAVWWRMPSLGLRLPLSGSGYPRLPACLQQGMGRSKAG